MSLGETAVGQALAAGFWTVSLTAVLGFIYALFMGLGYWLHSAVMSSDSNVRWAHLFWLGLIALVGTLQVLHLFYPVNGAVRLAVFVIGCAGFVRLVRKGWLPTVSRQGFLTLALLMPILLFIANQALGDPKHGDSGLYHFPAILWITSFPIVPGLGNLHEWLGFNQSYFLYAAVLNIGPSILQDYHLANSLLLMALAIELFRGLHLRHENNGPDPRALFRLILVAPLAYYSTSIVNVSSPAPDTAVFVLGILMFVYLADFLFSNPQQNRLSNVLMILFLATLSITLKLTLTVFAAGLAITAMGLYFHQETKKGHPQLLALGKGLILSLVLFVPWIVRGIVTSGYPLFPSVAFGLPVDWRVPEALASNIGKVVRSWARLPEQDPDVVLGSWNWIHPWSESFLDQGGVLLLLVCIGMLLSIGLYLVGAKRLPSLGKWFVPLPALVAGTGFWFWAAPAPRFIEPVMYGLLAWVWMLPLLVFSTGIGTKILHSDSKTILLPMASLASILVIGAERVGPLNIIPEPVRTAETRVFVTHSGLSVTVPLPGSSLWQSPLPGARVPRANLVLRGSGLESGFRLEGSTPVPDLVSQTND